MADPIKAAAAVAAAAVATPVVSDSLYRTCFLSYCMVQSIQAGETSVFYF